MKRTVSLILGALLLLCLSACRGADRGTDGPEPISPGAEAQGPGDPAAPEASPAEEEAMIYAHIGAQVLTIWPEANSSAAAFVEMLAQGDVTVEMRDYGGFEKVGPLGTALPTNDERITTEPGDVILYQGDQITIYYDVNTWTFTRLGRVRGLTPAELKAALGDGDPTVVFSLEKEGPTAER